MFDKMSVIALFTASLIIIALNTGFHTLEDHISFNKNNKETIAWPTYKYSFNRQGYFNMSLITGSVKPGYTLIDYSIAWRTRAELCIASSPSIGDVDGDGSFEAIYSSCDGYLYVVNAVNGAVEWRYVTGGEFADPTLYDVDSDGLPEILTVGSSGIFYCIDGNGDLLWSIEDRMFKGSPAIGLFKASGEPEIVMGSIDGKLYILELNGSIEVVLNMGSDPIDTSSVYDIDYDGLDEIVAVGGQYIYVVDYAGEWSVYSVKLDDRLVSPPVIYDLNGDGYFEAITVSIHAKVYDVDLVNGSILHEIKLPATDASASPSIGDLIGDDAPEVVVASLQGVYVLDQGFNVLRSYTDLQVYTSSPIIADLDFNGKNEFVVGLETGDVVIVDPRVEAHELREIEWIYTTNGPIMGSAAIADVDGDRVPEFLIGSRDYYMYCFKPLISSPTAIQNAGGSTSGEGIFINASSIESVNNAGKAYSTNTTTSQPLGKTSSISLNLSTLHREGYRLNYAAIVIALVVALITAVMVYLATRE